MGLTSKPAVIPEKAGIQVNFKNIAKMDSHFRENDQACLS